MSYAEAKAAVCNWIAASPPPDDRIRWVVLGISPRGVRADAYESRNGASRLLVQQGLGADIDTALATLAPKLNK